MAQTHRFALFGRSRAHLAAAGESYGRHLRFAGTVGTLLVLAGIACLLHALLPAVFKDHASRTIRRLHDALESRPAPLRLGADAGGLLTLFALSIAAALLPWIGGTQPALAASLSFLALGFPMAALGAGDDDEDDDLWGDATEPRTEIVIIGAGFSGTVLAVQLLRHEGVRVTLVDRRSEAARGLAYSTAQPNHLLNVRAARMSAFPDDPDHFVRWLRRRGLGGPADFVPRRSYGAYLEDMLAEARAQAGGRLKFVTAAAIDVETGGNRPRVQLDDGRALDADRVVLALGNQPPAPVLDGATLAPGFYANDPWATGLGEGLTEDDTVLLIGTGLTMIDAAVALVDDGFRGRIVAVSRRGLLPRGHAEGTAPPWRHVYPLHLPLSGLLREVRERAEGIGWRAAIDELRPVTGELWRGADDATRARFLRHLRPWWEVHRHRIAPAIADRIDVLKATGRFEAVASRIVGVTGTGPAVQVSLRLRGTAFPRTVKVARIVNCTGPGPIAGAADPLLRRLLAKGAVHADRQGLGIAVDDLGEAAPGLSAIGPIARGRDWEMTAVPELRTAAAGLAAHLTMATPTRA